MKRSLSLSFSVSPFCWCVLAKTAWDFIAGSLRLIIINWTHKSVTTLQIKGQTFGFSCLSCWCTATLSLAFTHTLTPSSLKLVPHLDKGFYPGVINVHSDLVISRHALTYTAHWYETSTTYGSCCSISHFHASEWINIQCFCTQVC